VTWNKSIVDIFSKTKRPKSVALYKATELYKFLKSYKTSADYFKGITKELLAEPNSLAKAFSILFKNLRGKPPRGAKDGGAGWLNSFVKKLASAYVNTFNITKIGAGGTAVFDSKITPDAKETAVVDRIDKELLQQNVLDPAGFTPWRIVTKAGQPAQTVTFSAVLNKLTKAVLKGFIKT
jgi:hypothetical protein